MSYRLEFLPSAQKEWEKFGAAVKSQFAKKLRERLDTPRLPSAALHGIPDCFKIKLRQSGCRLVYRVVDLKITVLVVAVGKRERGEVYDAARQGQ